MEYAGNILADDVALASSHTLGHHDGCAFLKSCVTVHFTLAANLCRRAALGEIPSIRSTSSSQRIDLKPMP